jgi:hypothetical protein
VPLQAPPRSVSLLARLAATFGGMIQQMGWMFFSFGMVFFWVFAANSELVSMVKFFGDLDVVEGQSLGTNATSASENDQSIYEVRYSYEVDGRRFEGSSYTFEAGYASAGEPVTVEYRAGSPAVSRIQGLRGGMFGWGVVFVIIFPGIGLGMIIFPLRKRMREGSLLRDGTAVYGKLVNKEATNTEINEQTVYALTFEFEDDRGMVQRAVAKSHRPERLEDDAEELILYDPRDPRRHVLVDNLAGGVEVAPDGSLALRSAGGAIKVLILPTLTVGAHVLLALYWALG